MGKKLNDPKPNSLTELMVMGGHRHALLQDSLSSQSLPAVDLLQLMEKGGDFQIACIRK